LAGCPNRIQPELLRLRLTFRQTQSRIFDGVKMNKSASVLNPHGPESAFIAYESAKKQLLNGTKETRKDWNAPGRAIGQPQKRHYHLFSPAGTKAQAAPAGLGHLPGAGWLSTG